MGACGRGTACRSFLARKCNTPKPDPDEANGQIDEAGGQEAQFQLVQHHACNDECQQPGYGENSRVLKWAFERLDGVPPGRITITYEGGLDPAPSSVPPTRIELDNAWFGYRLVLEGLSIQPL
jgi:hypothetical protein